jgi:hypothetical protein
VEDVREAVSGPVLVLGTTEAEDVSRVLIGFRDGYPVYALLERGGCNRDCLMEYWSEVPDCGYVGWFFFGETGGGRLKALSSEGKWATLATEGWSRERLVGPLGGAAVGERE